MFTILFKFCLIETIARDGRKSLSAMFGYSRNREELYSLQMKLGCIPFFSNFVLWELQRDMEGSLQVQHIVLLGAYIDQNFLRMKLNRCRSFQLCPIGITENDGSEPPSATFYHSRSRHGQEFCMNEVDCMPFDSTLLHKSYR